LNIAPELAYRALTSQAMLEQIIVIRRQLAHATARAIPLSIWTAVGIQIRANRLAV
jgi:hypothetical protein